MKTIIITGANGNLGAVAVKKFLEGDYRVIAVAHSGSELGFARDNKNFELHEVDLANESAALLFVNEAMSLYGAIDCAVFLAGGFAIGKIEDTTVSDLKKMFTLNFETAYHISRMLFAHMLQNDYGRLVFIGAKPALHPKQAANSLAYALSKSLLFNYANILNAMADGKNVTASVVVPSTIDTEPNRKSMPDADWAKWVKAEQVADVIEFICSDRSLALREPIYKVYNNA